MEGRWLDERKLGYQCLCVERTKRRAEGCVRWHHAMKDVNITHRRPLRVHSGALNQGKHLRGGFVLCTRTTITNRTSTLLTSSSTS